MDKTLIYKYLAGEASPYEEDTLMRWISASKENESFFVGQMNLWIAMDNQYPRRRTSEAKYEQLLTKVKRAPRKRRFSRSHLVLAACLSLFIGVAFGWIFFKYRSMLSDTSNTLSDGLSMKHSIYTVKGTKAKLILPDSSAVWLNSDSHMEYPQIFTGNARRVLLKGEAYFDVTSDKDRPMIIDNGKGQQLYVYGTKFNLKTYEDSDKMDITLYEGHISLYEKRSDEMVLLTDMKERGMVRIDLEDKKIETQQIENEYVESAWRDGRLIFNESSIAEVAKSLERWYGVDIKIIDAEINNRKFTAQFDSETIVAVLEAIKLTTMVDYTIQGSKVVLTDIKNKK